MAVSNTKHLDFSAPPPIPVRRFTVEEYHRLGDVEVLTTDDRVELLEGWILEKTVQNPRHGATIDHLGDVLAGRLPPGWRVRVQLPVTMEDSEPEPDLAIVRGGASRYSQRHPRPEDVGFLIEVADTSIAQDRDFKGRIYARARVPIYWIINLVSRRIEVYSAPSGPAEQPAFAGRAEYSAGDSVPMILDEREIGTVPARDIFIG